jgi:hypothetical protein
MDAEFHLPSSFVSESPPKQKVIGKELLILQEAYRVGTMMVRFSSLLPHPLQREINSMWYKELAIKHFENGANIQKGRYPIVVMAVREGDVGRIDVPGDLPLAMNGDKFYLISGQHRLHAMNYIIEARLVGKKGSTINHLEVLRDPDAEWPAVVYRSGMLRHS